jgi:hypothetical protein
VLSAAHGAQARLPLYLDSAGRPPRVHAAKSRSLVWAPQCLGSADVQIQEGGARPRHVSAFSGRFWMRSFCGQCRRTAQPPFFLCVLSGSGPSTLSALFHEARIAGARAGPTLRVGGLLERVLGNLSRLCDRKDGSTWHPRTASLGCHTCLHAQLGQQRISRLQSAVPSARKIKG